MFWLNLSLKVLSSFRRARRVATMKIINTSARAAIIKYNVFPIGLLNRRGIEIISRDADIARPIIEYVNFIIIAESRPYFIVN